jgi:hypothetical protein
MAWRTIGLVVAVTLPTVTVAQAPPDSKPPVVPHVERGDPNPCGAQATVGRGGGVDVQKPDDKSLSDKLAQSSGVICPPPHVDPDMKHPAPPGGTMPVIPPEAVRPNAQPK